MAATMTSVMDFTPKVVEYIQVCKKMGIEMLPPDVNEGFSHFSVSRKKESEKKDGSRIRFALSAIKNVGRGAINALVAVREANGPYIGLTDFIRRLDEAGENINKRFVEGLIKAGAFDSLGGKRSQYMSAYKGIIEGIAHTRKRTFEGQLNLFELEGQETYTATDQLTSMEELDLRTLLNNEKEALGLYISGHPLTAYEDVLSQHTDDTSLSLTTEKVDRQRVTYGGIITGRTIKYTRASQKPMAFITVEDMYGTVEVIVFSQLYEKYGPRLMADQVVLVEGQVSLREDEEAKIIADDIRFYDDLVTRTFWVKIPKERPDSLQMVTNILHAYPGDTQVKIYDERQKKRFTTGEGIDPCKPLIENLEGVLGAGTVKLV